MVAQLALVPRDDRRGAGGDTGGAAQRLDDEVVTASAVTNEHVEGGRGGAFFDVATYMEALRIGALVDELVDGGGIAVKGEDHGTVLRKEAHKLVVVHAVRMPGDA